MNVPRIPPPWQSPKRPVPPRPRKVREVAPQHFLMRGQNDLLAARQQARTMALELGCTSTRAACVAVVTSELGRNILLYAGSGEIFLRPAASALDPGLVIIAEDHGPGIPNREAALKEGYSSSGGLGLGLPAVLKLADEFEIITAPGEGVWIRAVIKCHPSSWGKSSPGGDGRAP